jgi:undecaprenyl-diphosphatase
MGITWLIHTLIKLFYFKPRPYVKHRVGILIPSKMDSTFPSKHTLFVFAISTSIFFYNRVLGSILWVLSVLTGFSRIWVGHHYPSDVIGSAFIATMTSTLLEKISSKVNDSASQ